MRRAPATMIGPAAAILVQVAPASEPRPQKVRSRSCWSSAMKTSTPVKAPAMAPSAMPASSMVATEVWPRRVATR